MELLLSNYSPAKFANESLNSFFKRNILETDILRIASGYISTEALTELKRFVEEYGKPHIELMIGMHKFDGFTKPQYEAASLLNSFLNTNKLGRLYIATTFKFHGKLYSFSHSKEPFAAVVGSSNLGSIFNPIERQYEADFLLLDKTFAANIDIAIQKLIQATSINFEDVKIEKFNEYNSLLENHEGVERIDKNSLEAILKNRNHVIFEIPIKAAEDAPKSNLNVYFGKGRDNKRGLIKPRAWYEAELIVPMEITRDADYPSQKSFMVITDDGWKFECTTNGTNSKNFRSEDNLQILGKWIKGRLEKAGVLKVGTQVTDETLIKYGRDSFSLIGTLEPNIWLLDFKVN